MSAFFFVDWFVAQIYVSMCQTYTEIMQGISNVL